MSHPDDRPASRAWRIPDGLRWGVGLAFLAAMISGGSIVLNAFAVRQLPDPYLYTTAKNAVAAVVLLGVAFLAVRPTAVRSLDRRSVAGIGLIAVIGGSLPFLLFFGGLAAATAPTAAVIQKSLFVWVAILAVPFLGERLGLAQVVALAVLAAGQFLATPPSGLAWGSGETMILVATLLWSVEVIVARRLLVSVPAPVLAAGRLGLGLVVLVGALALTGRLGMLGALSVVQWAWVGATGLVLAAYVGTWFAALRRAPASLVTAILVVGAPITAILNGLVTGKVPAAPSIGGLALIGTAAVVLAAIALRGSIGGRRATVRAEA